jgi:hypothetical protein
MTTSHLRTADAICNKFNCWPISLPFPASRRKKVPSIASQPKVGFKILTASGHVFSSAESVNCLKQLKSEIIVLFEWADGRTRAKKWKMRTIEAHSVASSLFRPTIGSAATCDKEKLEIRPSLRKIEPILTAIFGGRGKLLIERKCTKTKEKYWRGVAQRSVAAVKRLLFFRLPTVEQGPTRRILKGPVTLFCSLTILVANFLTDSLGVTLFGSPRRGGRNLQLSSPLEAVRSATISAPQKHKHPAGTISKLSSSHFKVPGCAFEAQHNESAKFNFQSSGQSLVIRRIFCR